MTMPRRHLGANGPEVSAIALGCMGMSGMYGPADERESIATIHAAIDAGIALIDTGDFYGMGHNEMLIGRALEGGLRDRVLLSVKFAAMRAPNGAWVGIDARPVAVRNFCAYSLQRLRTDHIDIYRPSRVDPAVPIEETAGAVKDLISGGHVRHLGMSEASAETVRRAHAVQPVVDLQIEYALVTRGIERQILPALRDLGVGVTAYGVLSRGLLSGSKPAPTGDFRAHLPRFTGENGARNQRIIDSLRQFAEQRGRTPAEVAIAWALAKGDDIVPVIGARTRTQLADALKAVERRMTPEDVSALESLVRPDEIAGDRYGAEAMRALDSERQ